jgi:hypothetical protein
VQYIIWKRKEARFTFKFHEGFSFNWYGSSNGVDPGAVHTVAIKLHGMRPNLQGFAGRGMK